MELRHLRYFLAVAEELHFGRAAERLHMAQPPLSQQIKKLEEELGVRLFARTKRRVGLTEAGRVFQGEARAALERVEGAAEAARRAGRGELGRLEVGFVGSAIHGVLSDVLGVYRRRYPGVVLVLEEMTTARQLEALRDGWVRVGFARPPVAEGGVAMETVAREPLVAALPEGHLLSGRQRVRLRDLAGEPFVMFPRGAGPGFYDEVVGACRRAGFSPRVVQEAIQMQTIVSMVASGLGVALVPASLRNFSRRGVSYVGLSPTAPEVEVAALWREGDDSPVLGTFLAVTREVAAGAAGARDPSGSGAVADPAGCDAGGRKGG